MTQLVQQLAHWRDIQRLWQASSQRVAFVPTMGNLHEGHFSLVKLAQAHADKVVVSIFVNPLQFGPNEDFDRYPRTLDADMAALTELGVDVVLAPSVTDMYPERLKTSSSGDGFVVVPPVALTDTLCGLSRVGHFNGVATIVLKLFNLVQPQMAFFGEKDYQQLVIIKAMVASLNLPIEVRSAPTCRAIDGLALSSRNQYLTYEQRVIASVIYKVLQEVKQGLLSAQTSDQLIIQATDRLMAAGFDAVDYVAIRDPNTLATVEHLGEGRALVLIAAKLGKTRLIDNLVVEDTRLA